MAYTNIWEKSKWCSSPTAYWTVQYEYQRNGADMQYRFKWKVWLAYSDSFYNNGLQLKLFLDGVLKDTITVKGTTSGTWSREGETGWYTVSNKTSGSTSFSAQLYDTATKTTESTSKTFYLTVSDATSSLGAISDFNAGSSIPIKITKYNTSFTDSLEIKYGSVSLKTISPITNGATVSLTEEEWDKFYNNNTNSRKGTFTFILTSKNGSTEIGTSEQTATVTIANLNPIYTDDQITYFDDNSNITKITDNNQAIIQGKSWLQVNVGEAIGQKGATITEYSCILNQIRYSTDGSTHIYRDIVNSTPDITFEITAKDSRGNTTTAKKTITVYPCIEPIITPISEYGKIICERCNDAGISDKKGDHLRVAVSGRWYNHPDINNTATIEVRCTGDMMDTDWLPLPIPNKYVVQGGTEADKYMSWYNIDKVVPNNPDKDADNLIIETHKTYSVEIRCIDAFGESSDSIPFKIGTQDTCLHLGKGGTKAAFGKYAERENAVEINPNWEFYVKGKTLAEYIKEVMKNT